MFYKYRSNSVAAFKELFYGELYFSHLSELNDPYDTKTLFTFPSDIGKYERLLKFIEKEIHLPKYPCDISMPARYLAETELSYEELIEKIKSHHFQDLLNKSFKNKSGATDLSSLFRIKLLYQINKQVKKNIYICSFTKNSDAPIMWSHYANEHKGICLEFNSIDNHIFQNPLERKIKSKEGNGTYEYCGGMKFQFKEVKYNNKIKPLDGFLNFNEYIYGKKVSKNTINQFWKDFQDSAFRKYKKWEYEDEYRLVDFSDWMPTDITTEGAKVKPFIDRIFFYDQTQLTGLIFGLKMGSKERSEMEQIIHKMRERLRWGCSCLPVFQFYEAAQIHNRYKMNINPLYGLDSENNKFQPNEIEIKQEQQKKQIALLKRYCKTTIPPYALFN